MEEHQTRKTTDDTAGSVCRQTVDESESTRKQKMREKVSRECLPLARPGARVFIRKSETVQDKYSTHKGGRKTSVKVVPPVTDLRQR